MQDKIDRLHFMDSMRATLMMLGVVLHSAQVFNPKQNWVIYSHNTDHLMTYLISIISTFRMPAFFVVSGYFCFLTLKKYKAIKFLKMRLKRLVVPFVFSALTLNSCQAIFLNWVGWSPFDFTEYIVNGEYVSHLWFLINLIVYFLAAGVFVAFFEPIAKLAVNLFKKIFNKVSMLVIIIAMPLFSIAILTLNKIGFPLYSNFFGVFNTHSILLYSPFFIFGIAIAIHKNFLYRFCTINPIACLVAILVSNILVALVVDADELFFVIVENYFSLLSEWLSVIVCFFIFYHFFNKQSKVMRILSDSSYTVYLFHHFLVIILGVLLIYLDFPAILGFVLLMGVVASLALLIQNRIISKNKALSFMFNGK